MPRTVTLIPALVLLFWGTAGLAQQGTLTDISGVGPAYAAKLADAGIRTQEALLAAAGTRKGRERLAEQTGISSNLLLEWVNRADLSRIRGVGREYADLLEAAGVDSPGELARRNPQHLFDRLKKVNNEKQLVRRLPSLSQVNQWVARARRLKPVTTE